MNRYGWVADNPDQRDLLYQLVAPVGLPPAVDLRPRLEKQSIVLGAKTDAVTEVDALKRHRRKKGGLNPTRPVPPFLAKPTFSR